MRAAGIAAGLLLSLLSAEARAQTCTRPTDPAGAAGYAYGTAPALHFDEAQVRVWYTTEGSHRVNPASTRPDGVPDDVARTAEVTEDALVRYAGMGYRPPRTDEDATCGSNGGDGRLDVYLVDFASADGTAVAERCTASGNADLCASFILAESNFAGRYPTADEGIRTVLPHEVFHAIQNAYNAKMDRFWAEGTAQWATKLLHPALTDLERFLPAFFRETSRSLDLPPGGVTASYLYGTAIWPIYLSEAHGDDIVRGILEKQADGSSALAAADSILRARGPGASSLASEFTRFAVWNAATGTRAMNLGYRDAKSYPMLEVADFAGDKVSGATAGLASFYYRLKLDSEKVLSLEADSARTSATVIPLDGTAARIDRAMALVVGSTSPAKVSGESIVVVSGITTSKRDALFSLTLGAPPATDPPAPNPPAKDPPPMGSSDSSGGCSASGSSGTFSPWALVLGLALFITACGRSSSQSNGPEDAGPAADLALKEKKPDVRIVTVGGPVTETVFALGAGDQVVGVDTSSVHPDKAHGLPHVGYQRTLGAEGVLSLHPTLVLGVPEAGPPAALEQIRSAGVRLEIIAGEPSIETARSRIEKLGEILGRDSQKALADLDSDIERARALVSKATSHPKVLALYARGQGVLHAFGEHSAADTMLRLAGATNAVKGFDGTKPLAPEAMVQAAPDIILLPSRGLESLGGMDGLLKVSGISQTPAGKAKRVVTMDDLLLLGFGPRTGQAIGELARKVHPELKAESD